MFFDVAAHIHRFFRFNQIDRDTIFTYLAEKEAMFALELSFLLVNEGSFNKKIELLMLTETSSSANTM